MTRPPLPPFDAASAAAKVQAAEDAWNTRDPVRVAAAYSPDSVWRNRDRFLTGRAEITAFLRRSGTASSSTRCARTCGRSRATASPRGSSTSATTSTGSGGVRYGIELWEFDDEGYMRRREASINDVRIDAAERRIHGPRPEAERAGPPQPLR